MSVVSVVCFQSGRGLSDGLITRAVESYRLWRVFETSRMSRPWPTGRLSPKNKQTTHPSAVNFFLIIENYGLKYRY